MRIAFHVPRASFLGQGYSGDHVLVAGLLEGLRERGHEVEIVSRLDVREVGRGRVPLHRLIREAIRVRAHMRRFAPDAWLVYTPSVTEPDLFGWWLRRTRYVLFAAYYGQEDRLRWVWRPLLTAAHRRSLRAANAVTVFRPRTATRIRAFGVAPERIAMLPPAVRLPQLADTQEQARRTLGLPPDAPVVLCVARFTTRGKYGRPGKTTMILELLRAVAALPPSVVCVVVGSGKGRAEIEDERTRLGLQARVRLAGRVPDVGPYYAACDVFAYPYDLDRPWVAVLEAQAHGRPVVTMRTGSAEQIVEDARTGLLAANGDEFRAHLARLVEDRERCEAMGQAARQYIERVHSMDVRVGQIVQLLSDPGQAPP